MEFSECCALILCLFWMHDFLTCGVGVDAFIVDVAAHEKDPLRRVAFVAAFAMANYSSTIGRIAKPFNPMLVSS